MCTLCVSKCDLPHHLTTCCRAFHSCRRPAHRRHYASQSSLPGLPYLAPIRYNRHSPNGRLLHAFPAFVRAGSVNGSRCMRTRNLVARRVKPNWDAVAVLISHDLVIESRLNNPRAHSILLLDRYHRRFTSFRRLIAPAALIRDVIHQVLTKPGGRGRPRGVMQRTTSRWGERPASDRTVCLYPR